MFSRTEGENSMDTEGEGEPLNPNEIELVFKPHPTEMTGDNQLMRALRDSSVRYLKTTANASGGDLNNIGFIMFLYVFPQELQICRDNTSIDSALHGITSTYFYYYGGAIQSVRSSLSLQPVIKSQGGQY